MVITSRAASEPRRVFGFLRLFFASLVIVAHTPEYADGDRHREPLSRLFGTLSCGELAVAGFFIISGFLITGSYCHSRSRASYLKKRVARIYPGYAVAFVVSVFVVAPLGGAAIGRLHEAVYAAGAIPLLRYPLVSGAFAGQPFPMVNGAMWTIAYEFRCYLLVLVLGAANLLNRAWLLALAAAALCLVGTLLPASVDHMVDNYPMREALLGRPLSDVRMTGLFLAGASWYPGRQWMRTDWRMALLAVLLLGLSLRSPIFCQFGVAMFGSYLIFYAAQAAAATGLARINERTDISYGLYLYASPILNLFIRFAPAATPLWLIGAATWAGAALCGWLSWIIVERPVLHWTKRIPAATADLDDGRPTSPAAAGQKLDGAHAL